MEVGFDIINDLWLEPGDTFDWAHKASNLYCILAGNISSDTSTIIKVLTQLSPHYIRILYIPGSLEYAGYPDINYRTEELLAISDHIDNVTILYQRVVMVSGIAIVGCNGWSMTDDVEFDISLIGHLCEKEEDLSYLTNSVGKLQCYLDTKKIIVVTNSVPFESMYFGQVNKNTAIDMSKYILAADTQRKICTWVFGTYKNVVDVTRDNINYINNARITSLDMYWPKRLMINV